MRVVPVHLVCGNVIRANFRNLRLPKQAGMANSIRMIRIRLIMIFYPQVVSPGGSWHPPDTTSPDSVRAALRSDGRANHYPASINLRGLVRRVNETILKRALTDKGQVSISLDPLLNGAVSRFTAQREARNTWETSQEGRIQVRSVPARFQ